RPPAPDATREAPEIGCQCRKRGRMSAADENRAAGGQAEMSKVFVIAQGGGPTAVINQTLAGATLAARRMHPGARVLGARHGVRGIRGGDFINLSDVSEEELRRIADTPNAALGSTRDKPDAEYCVRILEQLD